MRLSDAIALGRTLANPIAYTFYDPLMQRACARGMACLAVGEELRAGDAEKEIWPWLNEQFDHPCGGTGGECPHTRYQSPAWAIINHLMCHAVGEKDNAPFPQTWTLDQLIDWVRSVEPAESTEEKAFARLEEEWHDAEANTR